MATIALAIKAAAVSIAVSIPVTLANDYSFAAPISIADMQFDLRDLE